MGESAQGHSAAGTRLEFLASRLGLDQSCHVCRKLTAKPYVPGSPRCHRLALVKESCCFDLLWALGFLAALGTCLFILPADIW